MSRMKAVRKKRGGAGPQEFSKTESTKTQTGGEKGYACAAVQTDRICLRTGWRARETQCQDDSKDVCPEQLDDGVVTG